MAVLPEPDFFCRPAGSGSDSNPKGHDMTGLYDVELDLDLLCRNLQASTQARTVDDVIRIMKSCGFHPLENGLWRCDDERLSCLAPGEVRAKRPAGITTVPA